MQAEIEILQVEKKIRSRVKKQMEKTQKEYYLNEQMQAIQKELGGGERDEFKNEIQEIEETLKTKRMSKEAGAKVKKELKKLKMMHPTSAEATVVRNYIDWIISLPWYEKSEETLRSRRRPTRSSTRTTTASRRSRSASSSTSPCRRSRRSSRARCSASSGLPASARRASPRASRGRRAASSCACRSAACATRPRSAATGARTSARCRASSSRSLQEGRDEQPGVPARRGRQDVDRLPRRPGGGAARGARPRAEPQLQRPLPRPRLRPLGRDVHHDREHARRASRSRCRTAWRSSSSPGTRSSRSSTSP